MCGEYVLNEPKLPVKSVVSFTHILMSCLSLELERQWDFQDNFEQITDRITRLVKLTELNPTQVDIDQMQTATKLMHYVETFLRAVNARQIFH